jgi:hypothetical protein
VALQEIEFMKLDNIFDNIAINIYCVPNGLLLYYISKENDLLSNNSFLIMAKIIVLSLLLIVITHSLYTSSYWAKKGIDVRDQ